VERSVDLLERVGAKVAGAVLNALPRKLPAGTPWHQEIAMPAPTDSPELVTHLFGDSQDLGEPRPEPGPGETTERTIVARAAVNPARGRARVVESTIVTPEAGTDDEAAEPADENEQRSGE
jgi:hypothetical protein